LRCQQLWSDTSTIESTQFAGSQQEIVTCVSATFDGRRLAEIDEISIVCRQWQTDKRRWRTVPFTGHLSYTSVHRAGGPSGGYKATLQRGGWYGIDSGGPPSSSVVTGYDYRSNCAI